MEPHLSFRTHPLLLLSSLWVIFSTTGCFSSIKIDHPPLEAPQKIGGKVSVVAAPSPEDSEPNPYEIIDERHLEELASLLTETRLFNEVRPGPWPEADLEVRVHESHQPFYCGTPMMATVYTLGLFSTYLPAGGIAYNLEIRPADNRDPVVLERREFGTFLFGAKALPLRATKAWQRDFDDAWRVATVGALQHDLLERREALLPNPDGRVR